MPQRGDELRQSRRVKLARLRERGVDPFPPRFRRSHSTAGAINLFSEEEPSKAVCSVAGRITRIRGMGKASFIDIDDSTGRVQLFCRKDALGNGYSLLEDIDLGDFVGAAGAIIKTKAGEVSVEVSELTLLAKALRPPPEKFHGLRDIEQRYRQRYLDLIANRDVHQAMRSRGRIIAAVRTFYEERGYLEVDTPVLVPVPAGAMAEPFTTWHRALDRQLFLRIATELYLKRLIVGGMDKVFEIGRVFRNEGIDADHNPEFTLLESYEAYADYGDMMNLLESMVFEIANSAVGSAEVEWAGQSINLQPPWPRISLRDALLEHSGLDIDEYSDPAELASRLKEMGVPATYAESRGRLIDKLVSTFVEPKLIQPSFLVDYPVEMSPLAKARQDNPAYAERFEAFIAGMEIANSFTELNDPDVQRQRLVEQEDLRKLYQGEELDRLDQDFIVALEHGMPPTGGLGMGIDRLVMLLTGQRSIRDVMLFPQVRHFGNSQDYEEASRANEDSS